MIKAVFYKGQEIDPRDIKTLWDNGNRYTLTERTLQDIKLDDNPEHSDSEFSKGYDEGWDDCIKEVKHAINCL